MNLLVLAGGGVIGLAFVAVAVARPQLSLLLLVALDVSNINAVIGNHIGVSPYKPQLAIAILVLIVMVRQRMFRMVWSPVLLGLLVLFAGFCLSFAAAADPVTSQALLLERSRDLLYFLVVLAMMLSTRSIEPVARTAVIALAALAALTIVHQFVLHNNGELGGLSRVPLVQEDGASTPRHAGTSSDVNFWARLLILVSPLSLSLWAAARSRLAKVWWLGCAAALLFGTFLTQSRGGFIALFLAVVLWFALAGGGYRRSMLLLPPVLAVLVPVSGIGARLGTLTSITAGSTATADPSVVTRKRFQLDALRMFEDSPLTGHGIGSYGTLFPRYDRIANFYSPVDIVVAAHNFYLEQAADGGILLLAAWGIFFGSVFFAAERARRLAIANSQLGPQYLATGVIGSMVGWLGASVFLHLSDFRALLLIAALAAALDWRAREPAPAAVTAPSKLKPNPVAWGVAVVSLLAVGALSASSLILVLTTGHNRYTASATLGVLPATSKADPSIAYQLDVISRGLIVPTLASSLDAAISPAGVAQASGTTRRPVAVTVSASRLGGAVVISVTGDDPVDTAAWTATATRAAEATVTSLRIPYKVTGQPGPVGVVRPVRRWSAIPLAALLVAATMLLVRLARVEEDGPYPVSPAVSRTSRII